MTIYESINRFTEEIYSIRNCEDALNLVYEPANIVRLGKILISENIYNDAIQKFNKIINNDPSFSEAAYYYKSMAILNKTNLKSNSDKQLFIECLNASEKLLNEKIVTTTGFISVVNQIGVNSKMNSKALITIDAYRNQKENIISLYNLFIQSINDILGHEITPNLLINTDIKAQQAKFLYEHLLDKRVLNEKTIITKIHDGKINKIAKNFGFDVEKLESILGPSLKLDTEGIEHLKSQLDFPSREDLWSILIDEKVLINEIKFAAIVRTDNSDITLTQDDKNIFKALKEKELKHIYLLSQNISGGNKKWIVSSKRAEEFIRLKDDKNQIYFNSRATIDSQKLERIIYSDIKYGKLTPTDFQKIETIDENDSKEIYQILFQNGFLSRNGKLMKIDFSNIDLKQYKVYQQDIMAIIQIKCMYQIALLQLREMIQKLQTENLEDPNIEIDEILELKLPSNPHNDFIIELMDDKIINPVKYNVNFNENKTKELIKMNNEISRDTIKSFMPHENIEQLFNSLIECNWIKRNGSRYEIIDNIETLNDLPLESFLKSPLRNFLTFRKKLSDTKIIEKIAKSLIQLSSKINTLDTPTGSLKDIFDSFNSRDESLSDIIEEINIFTINGLEHIIVLEEKKYTWKMIHSCIACVLIGVIQIAIGVLIEWASVGWGTHVASGFISEGIGNIFYSIQSIRTGHFNWSDYGAYKLQSIAITALTGGFAAFLSRGAKVSRFGYKLVEKTGSNLTKTSGFALNAAAKNSMKESNISMTRMVNRISLKVGQGLAFGMVDATVSEITNRLLHDLCQTVSEEILLNVDEAVDKSDFNATLEQVYRLLGHEETDRLIKGWSEELEIRV